MSGSGDGPGGGCPVRAAKGKQELLRRNPGRDAGGQPAVSLSRRRLLTRLGAAALGPLAWRPGRLAAQGERHRIDVHQHFVSPSYHAALNTKNAAAPVPGLAAWKDFSPARAVEALDRVGIATAMLSVTAPGVWFGDPQEARRLARELNEYAAGSLAGAYKGRFGVFAVLPLPDIDGSLREIEFAFDALRVDGVGLLSSYGNQWLGDPAFLPVFEELNRRRAVVYVHPTDAACCPNMVPGVAAQVLEYPADTARTIVSLLAGSTASRTEAVTFVFSHAGGTLTAIAGRVLGAAADGASLSRPAEPGSRLYHLRRFYYDTAGAANPLNMQALKTLVSTSQIVFGTDAPFFDGAAVVQGLGSVGFTPEEIRAVERDNALRFLRRYA